METDQLVTPAEARAARRHIDDAKKAIALEERARERKQKRMVTTVIIVVSLIAGGLFFAWLLPQKITTDQMAFWMTVIYLVMMGVLVRFVTLR